MPVGVSNDTQLPARDVLQVRYVVRLRPVLPVYSTIWPGRHDVSAWLLVLPDAVDADEQTYNWGTRRFYGCTFVSRDPVTHTFHLFLVQHALGRCSGRSQPVACLKVVQKTAIRVMLYI